MSNYFSQVPDFEYVSRLPDAKISDFIQVKNLFKKGKLREDIFQSVAVFEKYGDYDTLFNGAHHHETTEIKDGNGIVVMPAGLRCDSTFAFSYTDSKSGTLFNLSNISKAVTNYEYESQLEDDKRSIFLLKPRYLNVVRDDMEEMMTYRKGSSQYKTESLKTGDNIRLFQ